MLRFLKFAVFAAHFYDSEILYFGLFAVPATGPTFASVTLTI
jgi:hypothetical protein